MEDLRALCLESDRKLRIMIDVGLKEGEEVQDIEIGHIETFPKVEAFEISESYSCWDNAEDSNEEADMEGSSRSADTVGDTTNRNEFLDSVDDANQGNDADAVEETPKEIVKRKTNSKVKRAPKTLEAGYGYD